MLRSFPSMKMVCIYHEENQSNYEMKCNCFFISDLCQKEKFVRREVDMYRDYIETFPYFSIAYLHLWEIFL